MDSNLNLPEGSTELAEQMIEEGRLPEAARILVNILQENPADARVLNDIGILSWVQGAWEDAYLMFRRSCEVAPEYCDAAMNLFDAALKLRRIPDAKRFISQAALLNPESEELTIFAEAVENNSNNIYNSERALKIGIYDPDIAEADRLLKEGDIMQSSARYLDVIDKHGPNADAYCGLGIVSYYRGDFRDAFSLFLESLKVNPFKKDSLLNLADTAKICGLVEDARKIFSTCLENCPGVADYIEEFEAVLDA